MKMSDTDLTLEPKVPPEKVPIQPLYVLPDVQHYCNLPRWPRGPAGAGLHPWKQDSLPDPARHVEECAHVKKYEE